jgi:hypothetical protein
VVAGLLFFYFHRKWLAHIEHSAAAKCERLRREEEAGIPPKASDYHCAISFDDAGFTVRNLREATPEVSMRWSDIACVTAFKRDQFCWDCICMFLGDTVQNGWELHEEMAGWKAFVKALPEHLPGCRGDWFRAVAFPPFETNAVELYRREGSHE